MCQNGIFKTFVSRSNESGCTFRLDCNCWACATCRTKLEADWNNHAENLFTACPDGIGYICVRFDNLQATMKRLSRAGAQYIRVRGHGIFHVYTTNHDLGQKRLTQQQAVDLFAEHLALAPSGQGHVISTSRAWRHARRDEDGPKMESDSICIATGLGPSTILDILERLNQTRASITPECLYFGFQSPQALENFVAAVKEKARPILSYEHKMRVANSLDSRATPVSGRSRFKPKRLLEPLPSP